MVSGRKAAQTGHSIGRKFVREKPLNSGQISTTRAGLQKRRVDDTSLVQFGGESLPLRSSL